MTMHAVEGSSNVHSHGYDKEATTMRIKFHGGGLYEATDVLPKEHAAFIAADSKGRHYSAHLKDKHDWVRIN